MFPLFAYQKIPRKRDYKNLRLFIHKIRTYFINYFIPNFIGDLIDLTLGNFIKNKYVFVRANGDHFGNWMYIFLFLNSLKKNDKRKIICLGRKGSVDKYWLDFFKQKNFIIIYQPLLRFIIFGFFFSKKLSVDVNGYIPYSYYVKKINYKNYISMSAISDDFMISNKLKPKNIITNLDKNKIFKKTLVLFYARSGNWKFSRRNSVRNMSEFNKNRIIDLLSTNNNVFLLGDTSISKEISSDNIFTSEDLVKINLTLDQIFSKADCVIGGFSGGSHFPSIMFNLPTLYIGEGGSPEIIGSMYLFPKTIPAKDKFFLINDEELKKYSNNDLKMILNEFIKTKNLEKIKNTRRYSVFCETYGITEFKPYKLGNMHLNNNFKKYKKGES